MNIVNHPVAKNKKSIWHLSRLSTAMALAFANISQAAPIGGVVAAGSAMISSSGSTTNIAQSTSKAVINWQSFNLTAAEAVNFVQPSSSSIALNRIQSNNGSIILGKISANGQVFLLNPNGILFGVGSQVSVGGMLASTRGISDANFMTGNYNFTGSSSASVINQGSLSANQEGGYIALLGANVQNNGIITARLGTVALVAGNDITIDLAGDHLLNVRIDQGTLNALISNGNLIIADGGQVLMSAQGAGSLLASAVNNTGIIQAQSIQNLHGSIILSAGTDAGINNVSGTLDASGLGLGSTGGNIQILGQTVNVSNAKINASGHSGGGEILIGGNFNGNGPQVNASYTNIDNKSVINADAIQTGNGGKVAVWSDTATSFAGEISAHGGSLSGNGGYVETSGPKLIVASTASVNTQAPNGIIGTWLLDPTNWTIALVGGDQTPAQVATSLASSNQTITATNDITVNAPVTWSTPQSLTLNAGHNVDINATVTASTAGAQFNIIAGNNANIGSTITASGLGNQINITAGQDIAALGATITASSFGTQLNMTAGGNLAIGTATTNGGGSMVLKANNNVTVGTASAAASGGTVSLIADADGTGPGVAGGTVVINTAVTATNTILRFNPLAYVSTGSEVTAYASKITGGTQDIKAWVFLQANNKVYDQATAATMSFKGTPTDASAVSLNVGTANFADKQVGTGKSVSYAGYSLGGTATNLALFSGTGSTTANITPASLTVSATGTNKVYDGNTTDIVSLSSIPITGDVVTPAYGAANFIDKNVGTAKTVNVTGISLTGADAGNYTPNTAAVTSANITAAPLTVMATGTNKIYDGNTTDTVSLSSNAVAGDVITPAYTAANFINKNVSSTKTVNVSGITISGADAGNYTPNSTAVTTANITAAPLTVMATGANKIYDGNTSDTVSLSSNAFTGDTVTPSYGVAQFIDSNVGNAKTVNVTGITISGADAGNYIANSTTTTIANITTNFTGAGVSPGVTTLEENNYSPTVSGVLTPLSLQQDSIYGSSSPFIVPFAGSSALTGLELGTENDLNTVPMLSTKTVIAQTPNKTDTLVVATPKKGLELQTLFPPTVMEPVLDPAKTKEPVKVITPIRPPKQGRN